MSKYTYTVTALFISNLLLSLNACSSDNAMNPISEDTIQSQKETAANIQIFDTNTANENTRRDTSYSNTQNVGNTRHYFSQHEIAEISKVYKKDSCDMADFNKQTKDYGFSNTYGDIYTDIEYDIEELNQQEKCLLLQHYKITTYLNTFYDSIDADGNNVTRKKSSKVNPESAEITTIAFDIDPAKFPYCYSHLKESPFLISYIKNEQGNTERFIEKNEGIIFDCYINQLSKSKNSTQKIQFQKINPTFYGKYEFGNYQTDKNTGTAIGIMYYLELTMNKCHIDMLGYETDDHFGCYPKVIDSNYIEIYDVEKNRKFGTIRKNNNNEFIIDMSYFLEDDNDSYIMDKVNDF